MSLWFPVDCGGLKNVPALDFKLRCPGGGAANPGKDCQIPRLELDEPCPGHCLFLRLPSPIHLPFL